MKKSLKTIALTTAVFALAACGSNGKWQAQLNEAQVAAKLAAENTKNLSGYLQRHLFPPRQSDSGRFRAACGGRRDPLRLHRPAELRRLRRFRTIVQTLYRPTQNWTARFGSSMYTACAGRRTSGRRSNSVTTFQARPCWPNTPKAGSRINWTLKTTAASVRKICKNG